ncbi:MAG: TldD/PmbA family protein [Bulleidia sp.]
MKAHFSDYLTRIAPGIRQLIGLLGKHYDYVSVLSTDSVGFQMSIMQRSKQISHQTLTTERGNTVRVCKDGLYSEYAFNDFDPAHPEEMADKICRNLDRQMDLLKRTGTAVYQTPVLEEEPLQLSIEMETGEMPEDCDLEQLVRFFSKLSEEGVSHPDIVECVANGSSTHISKMFMSAKRDMRQSYVISEGVIAAIGRKDGKSVQGYSAVTGRKGPEIFGGLDQCLQDALKQTEELLGAEPVKPGMYDVILSPDVSGLIAHEAFGHGVEMDMFVKNRALGKDYIGKRVGSDLVTMHEGASALEEVASYAFDDEGTLAGDVIEIDHGILKTGVCDALSALRLHTRPTGNGKRQNFEHKVYTRMTNTIFEKGNDSLEDMIHSISHGYLLAGMHSGMEDPKHWGIQCIVQRGYEIRDGKLNGKVAGPIVLTGYVPDLLGSISMAGTDVRAFGSGYCGKGYKEFVKVSDGGPYLKAKARLG